MTVSKLASATILGYPGHQQGPQTPAYLVVHGTVSATRYGGARATAAYFQSASSGGLAHYVVDPGEIIATCPEEIACWHSGHNANSIGFELCDPQAGPASRWADSLHVAELSLATRLVADVAGRHDIPLVKLSPAELAAGKRGIVGHNDVRLAWPGCTDHTDPGPDFPWEKFLAAVHAAQGPANVNPWHPHRLIQITGHPQVWQMRLRNGGELVKAPVPNPDALAAAKAQGQTSQLLIDNAANNAKVAAIPVVPWDPA